MTSPVLSQQPSRHYLSPRHVAESLSLREFMKLCSLCDKHAPETIMQYGYGHKSYTNVQTVAGQLIEMRFRVIEILREPDKLKVLVEFLDVSDARLQQWYDLS